MPATQSSGCAERKSTHFELILFWPAIGWNLAASADQPIAGQNRLSSKRVDFYSAQALGCEIVFHLRSTDLSAPSGVIMN